MSDDHQTEARELLARRVEDMTYFLSDAYAETDHEGDDEHGSHYDYGLSWEKEITNHREETVTYAHVLSTGGPHDEFRVTFDYKGSVESVTFVYLPWFDRVEIDVVPFAGPMGFPPVSYSDTVRDFYSTFYGDLVAEVSE
jgi:hypothetical protein